jgi:Sad1 / UNC-like C-terminal
MNALDCDSLLTCWNSEGNPKGKTSCFLSIEFGRVVEPVEVAIQFQAGFVAQELTVTKLDSNGEDWIQVSEFEVQDGHEAQSFSLAGGDKEDSIMTTALKLVFDECTDFYGRVTVYKLQVWGREVDTKEA